MSDARYMIELRGLTKRFGSFTAVDDISLNIGSGEFVTLLGPSGCGKTTLLRLIAGFEQPDAGTVWLGGGDVTRQPPYRRNVNQVFQSYALFPHLSVRDNISFGLRMQRLATPEIARRVDEAIALVSLGGLESRRPDQLSGGQRQRVALARALAPRPAVLLLDEPLSALDAKLRRGMQLELKRLQRQLGLTFVFVTHDQEEALTMSDRIAVMRGGRIEQLGTAEDIYNRPATAFVAEFVGETNLIEAVYIDRTDSHARYRVAGAQPWSFPLGEVPATGGSIRFSIRPENVELATTPPAADYILPATVREAIFQGAAHAILVECEGGLHLRATLRPGASLGAPRPGDRLYCGLNAENIRVLAAPSA